MCGKFTVQASWREVVEYSRPLTGDSGGGDEGGSAETETYRVGGQLPVIIWRAETKRRRVAPMRWAIPDKNGAPKNIHARAETVDKLPTFRASFLEGRRGSRRSQIPFFYTPWATSQALMTVFGTIPLRPGESTVGR